MVQQAVAGMEKQDLIKNALRVGVLVLLILVLVFLLIFFGIMKCGQVPVFGGVACDAYWFIKNFPYDGHPRVLIVYGDDGLGNPIEGEGNLRDLLSNPEILGVRSDIIHISRVNAGNLKGYDIVIVDRARTMETKTMRALIEYAIEPTGGTLVWTGDAGTVLGPDDQFLFREEREGTVTTEMEDDDMNVIGPWARKDGEIMVSLDEWLGVNIVNNSKPTFCEIIDCKGDTVLYVGNLETEPSGKHPLVRGMSATLPLWVVPKEDFAVVRTMSGGITTEALTLRFPANYQKDLNKGTPMIVASGVGERFIYYAMPLEYYANPKVKEAKGIEYILPLENLYYGITKGS